MDEASAPAPRRGPTLVVVAVVLIAALAALAWWSGAVAARVSVDEQSHEFFAEAGRGEAVFEVHNLGIVPLDVRSVFLQPELGWVRELSTDAVRLGPRESAELVVIYRVDCEQWDQSQRLDPIGVEASAVVGAASRTAISLDDAAAWCDAESGSDSGS